MTLNRISGLIVAVVGVILLFWIIPNHTEVADSGWLKPATLPKITAIIMTIAGLIHLIFPTGKAEFDVAFSRRVGLFFVIGIIGIYLFHLIGFVFTAPLLISAIMIMIGERRPLWLIAGILFLPAAIWFCVAQLLNRPLP